jgi:hypothetical protein
LAISPSNPRVRMRAKMESPTQRKKPNQALKFDEFDDIECSFHIFNGKKAPLYDAIFC